MSEFKHTKEPWRIGKNITTVVADDSKGLMIVGSKGSEAVRYYGGNLIGESISEENAKRIVLCVNACRNQSNENLSDDVVVKLKQDRDDLLEALEKITEGIAIDRKTGKIWSHWLDNFIVLVDKKKGLKA